MLSLSKAALAGLYLYKIIITDVCYLEFTLNIIWDLYICWHHLYTLADLLWSVNLMARFLAKDMELYHDQGGIIEGIEGMKKSMNDMHIFPDYGRSSSCLPSFFWLTFLGNNVDTLTPACHFQQALGSFLSWPILPLVRLITDRGISPPVPGGGGNHGVTCCLLIGPSLPVLYDH